MTLLRRRWLLALASALVIALAVAVVGVPSRSTVDASLTTEAAGGAWTFPGIPGDPTGAAVLPAPGGRRGRALRVVALVPVHGLPARPGGVARRGPAVRPL